MSGQVEAPNLAAFLRDISELTTRHQSTVEEQTKSGFVVWCDQASAIPGASSPYCERRDATGEALLRVERPGPEPVPPSVGPDGEMDPEEAAAFERRLAAWRGQKRTYDNLFAARTPPDGMELTVGVGLLGGSADGLTLRRHLLTAPAEIVLDPSSGTISVELGDAFEPEINWTPGLVRASLTENPEFGRLVEAECYTDTAAAVNRMVPTLGTGFRSLSSPQESLPRGEFGLGVLPAILFRRRDTSALLQLLRDMADDMASGGFVSEPFRMLVDPRYAPSEQTHQYERPALPLSANVAQREMIDKARTDAHVVIQGPPGTGKTHTIANLAAVLMAEGRRVLITAENERALREVQSKLPESMRPLLLPMLREKGTTSLEASVNALTGRANGGQSRDERLQDIEVTTSRLEELERAIEQAQSRLTKIAEADREERAIDGVRMCIEGHQQALASENAQLALVDSYLSESGHASAADAATVLEFTGLVTDAHRAMVQYQLPVGLMTPGELALWLEEHRKQLAVLGDPTPFDYSVLAGRIDELVLLATLLHGLPPVAWSEIDHPAISYREAAEECSQVGRDIDHGVTVHPVRGRASAMATLEAYLSLDATRFDQPIESLLAQHQRALGHAGTSTILGELSHYEMADTLTSACETALHALRNDRSGLLETRVLDLRAQGHSGTDALVQEAQELSSGARAPLGLPVEVGPGAPSTVELLRQAEGLKAHFEIGGKLTRFVGAPRAVREAAPLLEFVSVGGAPVHTAAEAARAVEYFEHRQHIELVDAWQAQHSLTRPAGVSHADWLTAIAGLTEAGETVARALRLADELVSYPAGDPIADPIQRLEVALATVSNEVAVSLNSLAETAGQQSSELRVAGAPIRSRSEAQSALSSLRASEIRERYHALLPSAWGSNCNPLDSDDDQLVRLLRIAAAAADLPSGARAAELTPSSANRIAERAQIDDRRRHLEMEHERIIGGLQRTIVACVPASPATQAIAAALRAENALEYRLAVEELEREREMAASALRLDRARMLVGEAHPNLLAAFDLGDRQAEEALVALFDLQSLRARRTTIQRWREEIGSTAEVHQLLATLDTEKGRVERRLADQRCWSNAIDRLKSSRELASSLSALSTAMSRVPKTRTARSYPARMRALREATRDAAPAIPCWVMAIDRVAEVLGYPTGENRFDVVIIDEASQAWFPAIFLYAIADQVIVVGDDLQTSPADQVLKHDDIEAVVNEHISGHRLANQVGPDLSLYDVALIMTAPDTMVDHFRCVPEIIHLSNRLSYEPNGKRLLPSRVRRPDSLDPVRDIRVAGERRLGSGPNEAEVAAIVEAVAGCHANPAYRGMDFGVVVVGSNPHAHLKLIQTRILEQLGGTAVQERNLEVGTPSQFQGAERNVMFLSLVEAAQPGEVLRVRAHEHTGRNRKFVQQLNVAVSRAKDQLWIFRSFDLGSLRPNDARTVLLEAPSIDLPQLDVELEKCDSQFERDVVNALAAADSSLVVRTQVEAIGYRIDVVLEDAEGRRLAVECDGDRWHMAPDRVRDDLYRQRTLERIGWSFCRFLASEWYDDPEAWTAATLESLTAQSSGGKQVVGHVVQAPTTGPVAEGSTAFAPDDEFLDGLSDLDDPYQETIEELHGDTAPSGTNHLPVDEQEEDEDIDLADLLEERYRSVPSDEPKHVDEDERPGQQLQIDLAGTDPQPGHADADGDRPNRSMTQQDVNRRLAAAMRSIRVEPNGDPWKRAKAALAGGRTFTDAAAVAAGRSVRAMPSPTLAGNDEALVCEACGQIWTRARARGRKPQMCPDCRNG